MIESLITFRVNLDASRLGLIDLKNKIKVKGQKISKENYRVLNSPRNE